MALINLRNALMAGKRLPYDAELAYLDTNGAYAVTQTSLANEDYVRIVATLTLQAWSGDQLVGTFPTQSATSGEKYKIGSRLIANSASPQYFLDIGFRRCYSNRWYLNQKTSLDLTASPLPSFYVNGTLRSVTNQYWGGSIDSTTPLSICSYADGTGQRGKLRIESLAIYQSSGPAIEIIPVRKGSTAYLYDRISGEMISAIGGTFVGGPDKS